MPTGKNWLKFFYVNISYVLYLTVIIYYIQVSNIKENWPLYRCNPIYMPLADDVNSNFIYCIQNMQTSYMGYLLQPLTFLTNSISNSINDLTNDINMNRAMFNNVRNSNSFITDSIFGVFLNLVIEFQKIIIGIKDLIGKTIGTMTTFLYVLDGSVLTMKSLWVGSNGNVVPGDLVRNLGKCFYPYTRIQLKNGLIKCIKDIDLGDVLEDGTIVETVMKIDNKRECLPLYVIYRGGINGDDIYVTGSHLVYDKKQNKFIRAENYSGAFMSRLQTDYFNCLITNTHRIKIGNEIFWDWEDHFVKT